MLLSDFDYDLPPELVAQQPLDDRSASRMLVVDRTRGQITDTDFVQLPRFLREGDVLVLNNTRVFPARLIGRSETGARIEVFLIRETGDGIWEALARPARRLRTGKRIIFDERLDGYVEQKFPDGKIWVRFAAAGDLEQVLDQIGRTPLPPYIRRDMSDPDADRERYQTVFAKRRGAIAAPTAGLHFTEEVLDAVRAAGAAITEITLHVGYGTFEPVREEDLTKHSVSAETYELSPSAAGLLNEAKEEKRRIVAIGTTTTRALESNLATYQTFTAGPHVADLTITPGYRFVAIDALLTNFHLPRSSLLVLTSTFGSHELIMEAYRHAVEERYRFYSYGDCMLII